jgi:IS30 family transposase
MPPKRKTLHQLSLGPGVHKVVIARALNRRRTTIQRKIKRNRERNGFYKPGIAQEIAVYRRRISRQSSYFTELEWGFVYESVREKWAPKQISARLSDDGLIQMHYGTIYREIKRNKRRGGTLFSHLRQASKNRRKRNGRPDSRGRLRGKRCISQRPKVATLRLENGHWEVDMMRGFRAQGWILTALDRKTRLVRIRKLSRKIVREVNRKPFPLIKRHGIKPITVLTQAKCFYMEQKLNGRPRKTLNFKTPGGCPYGI